MLTNLFYHILNLPDQDIIRRNLRAASSHHGAAATSSDRSSYINNKAIDVYIPPDLDPQSQRRLSLNLGNGNCQWQPPVYEVPNELEFHKVKRNARSIQHRCVVHDELTFPSLFSNAKIAKTKLIPPPRQL